MFASLGWVRRALSRTRASSDEDSSKRNKYRNMFDSTTENQSHREGTSTSSPQPIRIAIFVCFLNAGISTRGLEIAKALRELSGNEVHLRFFSWKGPESISYDHLVIDAGFNVAHYGPEIDETEWNELLEAEHKHRGFVLEKDRIKAFIEGASSAMKDFSPAIVLHGPLPDACIAAQIAGIPNIMYGPLPFWDDQWTEKNIMNDIPDAQVTWWTNLLPKFLRRKIMQHIYRRMKKKRSNVHQAAIECGWKPFDDGSTNRADHRATCYLLADLPSNYKRDDLGTNVEIIGPLFAGSSDTKEAPLPDHISHLLEADNKKKIFVTLGSTGHQEHVREAVKAVCMGKFNAIVALAPGRCKRNDIEHCVGGKIPDSVLLTEDFLPANKIAPMVDVVIGHGGQGTVQTALSSGTPIVGVAMQWEQQFNLDKNAVARGAGIRIPKRKWKADRIYASLQKVLDDKSYCDAAHIVQNEMLAANSANEAAKVILRTARCQVNAAKTVQETC